MPGRAFADFAECSATLSEPVDLWNLTVEYFYGRGVEMISYHHFGKPSKYRDMGIHGIRTQDFPADWVAHYLEHHLFEHDPIVALAARTSRPFFWRDIRDLVALTGLEERVIRDLESADLGDGLSLQVSGPNFRNGYLGLGFGRDKPRIPESRVFEFKCVAQIAHLRYCELVEDTEDAAETLTPREREVLNWIARGKSNGVIADILDVSRHTVDTLVRRIFDKLDVTDRTTAAVKALGSGLIGLTG